MSDPILARLQERGITLPEVATPAAAYVPFRQSGNQIIISGQLPFENGALAYAGKLGKGVTIEDGQDAARVCALNLLAVLNQAVEGDLASVKKILKLEILVASAPEFHEAHLVANGASDLIVDIFGKETGSHARVAYGVSSLPLNAAVEVAGLVEVD